MVTHTLKEEIIIRSIKILNIGWAAVAYFIITMGILLVVNKLLGPYDDEKENNKSNFRLTVELLIHAWLIGIVVYIVRNLFPLIPWPFDGIYGYSHNKVSEVVSATLFASFIVMFNNRFQEQVKLLRKKLKLGFELETDEENNKKNIGFFKLN